MRPSRPNPYQTFKFRLKLEGKYVAGFSKMSALASSAATLKHRGASDPSRAHVLAGTTKYEPITLQQGVTHDSEFMNWTQGVQKHRSKPGADAPPTYLRKDIVVEVLNEIGGVATAFTIFSCWVSAAQALPNLDAGAGTITIAMLKLENEGWRTNQK